MRIRAAMTAKGFPIFHIQHPAALDVFADIFYDPRPVFRSGADTRADGAGAFSGTHLEATLRTSRIANLILLGGAPHAINTTMRQASDRGFDVLIAHDGIAGAKEDLYGLTCSGIRKAIFAACANSDAIVACIEALPVGEGESEEEEEDFNVEMMEAVMAAHRSDKL